jgi:hypothetical protein
MIYFLTGSLKLADGTRIKTNKELEMQLIKWETKEEMGARKAADLDKLYKGNSAIGMVMFAVGIILFVYGMLNLARHSDYLFILEAGAIYMVVGALLWDWPRWLAEKLKERKLSREMAKQPKMGLKIDAPTTTEKSPPTAKETIGSNKQVS